MKYSKINGCYIDLDSVLDVTYDKDTYTLYIKKRLFLCITNTHIMHQVTKDDANKLYKLWDNRRRSGKALK